MLIARRLIRALYPSLVLQKGFMMKRRNLKKRISGLAGQLNSPAQKYIAATDKVHRDIIYSYESQLEVGIFRLVQLYLMLDRSWPHKARWLDGFGEEFTWVRKGVSLLGRSELSWGHRSRVSGPITFMPFAVELRLCAKHGAEYVMRYGEDKEVRCFSSKTVCAIPRKRV